MLVLFVHSFLLAIILWNNFFSERLFRGNSFWGLFFYGLFFIDSGDGGKLPEVCLYQKVPKAISPSSCDWMSARDIWSGWRRGELCGLPLSFSLWAVTVHNPWRSVTQDLGRLYNAVNVSLKSLNNNLLWSGLVAFSLLADSPWFVELLLYNTDSLMDVGQCFKNGTRRFHFYFLFSCFCYFRFL